MSIKYPIKFISFQGKKMNYIYIILPLVLLAFAENIQYFFYKLLVRKTLTTTYFNATVINGSVVNASEVSTQLNNVNVCYATFTLVIASGINSLFFRNFLPFTIILIFNTILIHHLYKNHVKLNTKRKVSGNVNFFISIIPPSLC